MPKTTISDEQREQLLETIYEELIELFPDQDTEIALVIRSDKMEEPDWSVTFQPEDFEMILIKTLKEQPNKN